MALKKFLINLILMIMMIVGLGSLFLAFLGFNEGFRNDINSTLFHVIAGSIGVILIIVSMVGERIFFPKKNKSLEKNEN